MERFLSLFRISGDSSLVNFGSDDEAPVPKRHCKGATRPAEFGSFTNSK